MSSPTPPGSAAGDTAALEQLLTHHMGPMAKIVIARARKTAADQDDFLALLAKNIVDRDERQAFLAGASRLTAFWNPLESPGTAASVREVPAEAPAPSVAASSVHTSARPQEPVTAMRSVPRTSGGDPSGGVMKGGSIFVSYARENLGVAQRIVAALREAGLEVWLDLGKLQPGDSWDLKIRRNIEGCSFFVALISRETEARPEGYFRREWNLAADRALNFADEVTFILPVTIDDTAAYAARVPERFRRAHWLKLPNGEVTSELVDSLKELVDDYARRSSPT